jgi:ABC-type phosphate/phosphonate transport system substrate-binding protein
LVKVNLDGSIGYHSIGFARVDSGVTSLDDMEGKVFGFGDPNSTSGYLIPSIEIPQYKDGMIPEGPVVLRQALPDDVKVTMTELVDGLFEADPDCAYGVAAGDTLGFQPVTHDTYISIVEARKAKIGG